MPDASRTAEDDSRFAPAEIGADVAALPANERARARPAGRSGAHHGRAVPAPGLGAATTRCCRICARSRRRRPRPRASRSAATRLHYFLINKGPWDRLDHNRPFVPGAPAKPEAANFYPDRRHQGRGSEMDRLAVGRRESGRHRLLHDDPPQRRSLRRVPYSIEYQGELARAADLLREAAQLTADADAEGVPDARADAFLSNDYYASDVAWMELDARDRADDRPVRGLRGRVVQLQGRLRGVHHRP